jgi:hypothetical protein
VADADDAHLREVVERANRVLNNNNASGSARSLAESALYLASILQEQNAAKRKRRMKAVKKAKIDNIIAQMEDQFDG